MVEEDRADANDAQRKPQRTHPISTQPESGSAAFRGGAGFFYGQGFAKDVLFHRFWVKASAASICG
jgi:hypothetical protein